jgi:hypothetical protein
MEHLPLIAGILDIGVAILFVVISIPLVLGKIPMNSAYGFRFAKSFESDDLWLRINRYGGRQLILWSIPIALLGVATLLFPVLAAHPVHFLLLTCAAPLAFIIAAAVACYRFANRL